MKDCPNNCGGCSCHLTAPCTCCTDHQELEEMDNNDELMQFFAYTHLPEHLQKISAPFCILAAALHEMLPDNEERHCAIRKLLEAKDCAVRSRLSK